MWQVFLFFFYSEKYFFVQDNVSYKHQLSLTPSCRQYSEVWLQHSRLHHTEGNICRFGPKWRRVAPGGSGIWSTSDPVRRGHEAPPTGRTRQCRLRADIHWRSLHRRGWLQVGMTAYCGINILIIPPANKVWGGYIGITLSVCLSRVNLTLTIAF